MANALANAMASGYERARNALADVRKRPGNALLDTTRGALMGVTTDVLGYPVDLATMAMRPFGYGVEQPVGGSDWLANHLTSPTGSPAEMAGRVATGMLTPGPEEMLRMAGMLPKNAIQELTVYHGSPHRINNVDEANPVGKFDLSKVGTGEGAQAYGHGIYLAENPNVARQYMTTGNIQQGAALNARARQTSQSNIAWLEKIQRGEIPRPHASRGSVVSDEWIAAEIADNRSVLEKAEKWGKNNAPSFYTVDLPDEHIAKMLDWDAPLSEQPESVRKALAPLIDGARWEPPRGDSNWALKDGSGKTILWRSAREGGGGNAQEFIGKMSGETIYSTLIGGKTKADASSRLREMGIPGIRYFDAGSRAAGEGTRNFVIFDGDTAKILKRE